MELSWVHIIIYLLLIDSIALNLIAWFGKRWYVEHFSVMARLFPAARGWAAYYLLVVLLVGHLLGVLF